MSTLTLPLSQQHEVTRRRLSLRRVEVTPASLRKRAARARPAQRSNR
ncbi:hypothetical protein ACU4HD_03000 [Cupriavidus basilensis]